MPSALAPADRKRWIWTALAVVVIFALDQWTKAAVSEQIPLFTSQEVIPGFFQLVHARNTGMAFSLFNDAAPWVKEIIIPTFSLLAVLFILFLQWRAPAEERWSPVGVALILGGAAGNLFDRAVQGYVVDFLDFYVGAYHWPAFNVADSSITIGAGLILLTAFRGPASEGAAKATEAA